MIPVRAGQQDSRQANVPACWSHPEVARSLSTAARSISRLTARENLAGPGPSLRALRWSAPHRLRLLQGCGCGGAGQRRVPALPCEWCGRWTSPRLWARNAHACALPRLQVSITPLPGITRVEAVRAGLIARPNPLARFVSCYTGVSLRDSARSLPSILWPRANGIICLPSLRRARLPDAYSRTGCRAQGKDPWAVLWLADPESSAIVWQPVRRWGQGG